MKIKTISIGFGVNRTPVPKVTAKLEKAIHLLVDPVVSTDKNGGVLYVFDSMNLWDDTVRVLSAFFDCRQMTLSMVGRISGGDQMNNCAALHHLVKAKIVEKVEVCGLEMFELRTEEVD